MKVLAIVFSLGLAFLLAALPSTAQEVRSLSAADAVDLAQDRNPRLQQVRSELRAKSAEWWMGWGLDAPSVGYFREGIPTGSDDGFAEQRWMASQSIDFPLKSYYRLERTSTEYDAMRYGLYAEQAAVRAGVKKAYTGVLYAQEIAHLRAEELSLAGRLVEAAQVRVEVGEASELELMKAELELAEAQSRGRESERDLHAARYALFREIGLDPDDQTYSIIFPDTLVDVVVDVTQEDVLSRISSLPELQAADLSVDAARMDVSHARASILPDLTFDVYRQDYGSGYDRYGVQVGLTFPIWVFSDYRGRMRQATAREQAVMWEREDRILDQKERAELAWHGYETSRSTMERYRTSVKARAEELLRLTLEGYRLGEIDLVSLLDTQRTYLSSQQRFYNALRDYYYQLIELERILGEELVYASGSSMQMTNNATGGN